MQYVTAWPVSLKFFLSLEYCRIDGSTAHKDRIAAIKPGSEKLIFLLTILASGGGWASILLLPMLLCTTAIGMHLIWIMGSILDTLSRNPQTDLQAMDHAHRICQTKQVYVFRFITEGGVEEWMRPLERTAQKLPLDQLAIQQGRTQAAKGM